MALKMTSIMVLIPYLLVAGYGALLAWSGQTYGDDARSRRANLISSAIAVVYTCLMIFAGGSKFVLLSTLLYLPSTVLFVQAMREQKLQVFTRVELMVLAVVALGALIGVYGLATGTIAI